jgi:hypothetical protein
MGGVYGEALIGPSHWFGEVARAPGGVFAGIAGTEVELAEGVEALLLARHYPTAFTSLYGRGHGASGESQNETGIYTALRLRRVERWDMAASFDQFWFPWLRFNIGRPTTGYAAAASAIYEPRDDLEISLWFRYKMREASARYADRTGIIRGVAPALRQTMRLQTTYRPANNWRIRTRAAFVRAKTVDSETHVGSLLYQDLRWSPVTDLRLDGRVTLFDAEHHSARLYAYESDLLYSFSVPVLYGRGQRAYLLVTWDIRDGIALQGKYAVSRYVDRDAVGSGWDAIEGHRLREMRFQVRIRW